MPKLDGVLDTILLRRPPYIETPPSGFRSRRAHILQQYFAQLQSGVILNVVLQIFHRKLMQPQTSTKKTT